MYAQNLVSATKMQFSWSPKGTLNYTHSKNKLLAFPFANFETTRADDARAGSRGLNCHGRAQWESYRVKTEKMVHVSSLPKKSYSSIWKKLSWTSEEFLFLGSVYNRINTAGITLTRGNLPKNNPEVKNIFHVSTPPLPNLAPNLLDSIIRCECMEKLDRLINIKVHVPRLMWTLDLSGLLAQLVEYGKTWQTWARL